MQPSLASLISAPDHRSVAVSARLTVMQAGETGGLESYASHNQPLSEQIERMVIRHEHHASISEAQDPPGLPEPTAQNPRLNSEVVDPGVSSGPAHGDGGPTGPRRAAVPTKSVAPTAPVPRPVASTAAPATGSPAGPGAVRAAGGRSASIPAAVVRAIEVEASLNPGSHSSAVRGSHAKKAASPTPRLAEAEGRTVRGLSLLTAQRGGRLRIQLEPVKLGPITIEVRVDRNQVSATIETATRGAQRVLEAATSRLRQALEVQGFTLDRLDVRPDATSGSTASAESSRDEDPTASRSDHADDEHRSRSRRHGRRSPVTSSEPFRLEDDSKDDQS